MILFISGCNFSKKDIQDPPTKLSTNRKAYELKKVNQQINKSSRQISEAYYKKNVRLSSTFEKQRGQNQNFSKKVSNKNKFYINLSCGYTNLKNYDVFDVSKNQAIWNDRYTENGNSIEIGLDRNIGKFRLEIYYAREKGRIDQYLTYLDGSITKFDPSRGKLHKDFYLLNTYFDFWKNKKLTPFIGLGIGLVESSQDSAPFIPEYVRKVFVKQLKVGISISSTESTIIFLEGYIRDSNSHITSDGIGTLYIYKAKDGFDSEGIQVGLRKYF